jgi:hypothetical protein
VKKALTWLALIIAVIYVINDPAGAAALAHKVMHSLATLAAGL